MDTFIFEDYLLQAIILLGFFVFLSPFAILELVQKRNKKIDKITINGCLSPGDLINFLKKQNMLGLEAIGNNGYSSSIILKTVESNIDGCNEFIVNAIDNFKDKYPNLNVEKDYYLIIDFSNELLNEGEKYGLEIVKG